MRRRRSRSLVLPIIILIAGLIYSQIERQSQQTRPTRPSAPPAAVFSGKVVGISDGDTIRVLQDNREVKVRLYGVDCPEKKQAYGMKAKQFTSGMVFGRMVSVDVRDTDRYGRTVGWVVTDDHKILNAELVRAGYAWWYESYAPNDTQLERLQAQAQAAHRGLWAGKNPVPPWEFRREHR